jgi:ANTAR domain
MAALAFQNIIQTIGYIRLDTSVAETDRDDALLLDAARVHTGSQVAVIYGHRGETSELKAIAARSSIETRVKNAGVTIGPAMSEWIESLAGPIQLSLADGAFFERFPEVFQYHLKRLLIVPLRAGDLLGLLTLGRVYDEAGFDAAQIQIAQRAGRLLTAVYERDWLQHKLLERKLVERAKGILQERRRLTEEQAYLLLRNSSRQRRVTMVHIAQEIIDAKTQRPPVRSWRAS